MKDPNQSTIIRAAQKADIEGIEAIENSSFDNVGERFHRRQIAALVANLRARVLVAQDADGKLLGWGAALTRQARRLGGRGTGRKGEKTPQSPISASPRLRVSASAVTGRIYAVAVHPHGRGLGIGKALMLKMMDDLHARGAKRIFLEVRADNAAAIGLYHKLGFVDAGNIDHYYGHQLHALKMVHNGQLATDHGQ
jgi:ribosomal protein S18 acetylase RimI-like enzyme